jgi:hypothetical protein
MIAANFIAPPEAALAVIGIRPLISREVERIRVMTLREIDRLPDELMAGARAVVRGEANERLKVGAADSARYRAMLKDFAKGYDAKQVDDMVAQFPAEYQTLGAGLVVLAAQVIQELGAMYPISTYQSVTGSINLLPPAPKLWQFARVLDLIDRPLSLFQLIAAGALLRSQARAFRTVYQTLSRAVDAAFVDAVKRAKTEKISFQLPVLAETGMCAWMDLPPGGADAASLVQSHDAAGKAKQAAMDRQASAASKRQGFEAAATQSQKTQPVS